MSDSPHHSASAHGLPPGVDRQDNEVINWRPLLWVAAASLTIFAVGVVYALWLLDAGSGAINQRANPAPAVLTGCQADPLRCAQVGIVEQRPFELEQRARGVKRAAAERLGSWGWIDRNKAVAHIPIDEAMKKVAGGERP